MESMGESRTIWQSIENIAGLHGSLKAFWTALLEELDVIGGGDMDFVPYKAHSSMARGAGCTSSNAGRTGWRHVTVTQLF